MVLHHEAHIAPRASLAYKCAAGNDSVEFAMLRITIDMRACKYAELTGELITAARIQCTRAQLSLIADAVDGVTKRHA